MCTVDEYLNVLTVNCSIRLLTDVYIWIFIFLHKNKDIVNGMPNVLSTADSNVHVNCTFKG